MGGRLHATGVKIKDERPVALEHVRGSPTITTGDCVESVLLLSPLVLFLFLIFYFIGYSAWLEGSQLLGQGFQVVKPGILTIRLPGSSLPQGFMWWLRLPGQPRPRVSFAPCGPLTGSPVRSSWTLS